MLIRVIGVGSPFGDDAAGLEAVRILDESPPLECEITAADRPGARLLELMGGARAVLLIDAVRSGAPPGTLHRLDFNALAQWQGRFVSSHDIGVAAVIGLAQVLGRAPAHGTLLGIEIGDTPVRWPCELSETTRQAVQAAVIQARAWLAKLSAADARADQWPLARPGPHQGGK
jgi:hydrogenase maturation protease